MTPEQTAVIQWIFGDDTGNSSMSLVASFLGVRQELVDAPFDPADLGRCLRLIRLVPGIRKHVDVLAERDENWSRLAPHWDKLAAMMEDEVGLDWEKAKKAHATYYAMRDALYGGGR